jgi:hypothetical protein
MGVSGGYAETIGSMSGTVNVRFSPEATHMPRSRELTRWATFCREHLQQKVSFERRTRAIEMVVRGVLKRWELRFYPTQRLSINAQYRGAALAMTSFCLSQ